jgi:hypothetical protein
VLLNRQRGFRVEETHRFLFEGQVDGLTGSDFRVGRGDDFYDFIAQFESHNLMRTLRLRYQTFRREDGLFCAGVP